MLSSLPKRTTMASHLNSSPTSVTNTTLVDSALAWLEKNQDTPIDELRASLASKTTSAASDDDDPHAEPPALKEGEVAQSLVCEDCGKRFRSEAQASFHADKSGHQNFAQSTEEIKPLTEEEKKERLAELRANVAAKRAKAAMEDKKREKENEKIRMKSTKEIQDAKEELAKKEQIKAAADKRREKLADIEAKKRIQAKIAADKEERRLKAEQLKAEREGRAPPADPSALNAATAQAAAPPKRAANTQHIEARLRLQTPGGNLMKTFPAETTLFEVAEALSVEVSGEVIAFTQTFPKKRFEREDFGMTLKEAGQVPSGVLVVNTA